jgi:hypothetical protein
MSIEIRLTAIPKCTLSSTSFLNRISQRLMAGSLLCSRSIKSFSATCRLCVDTREIGAGAVDEEMADEIIAKYKEKA